MDSFHFLYPDFKSSGLMNGDILFAVLMHLECLRMLLAALVVLMLSMLYVPSSMLKLASEVVNGPRSDLRGSVVNRVPSDWLKCAMLGLMSVSWRRSFLYILSLVPLLSSIMTWVSAPDWPVFMIMQSLW